VVSKNRFLLPEPTEIQNQKPNGKKKQQKKSQHTVVQTLTGKPFP